VPYVYICVRYLLSAIEDVILRGTYCVFFLKKIHVAFCMIGVGIGIV